jgi:hypothetical protein
VITALRGAALVGAIVAAALAATNDWRAWTIAAAFLPSFALICIAVARRRGDQSSVTISPRWTAALLPTVGVAGGIAWGATGDPMYLALSALAAVAAWSAHPGTLD